MTYAAEPYLQFVEDLLTSLTGGVSRETFVFLPENRPFRLAPPGTLYPDTVSVFGQSDAKYRRFQRDVDYELAGDEIRWRMDENALPAAGATLPEQATSFFVNYDYRAASGAPPLLSDRNVGSITRLFAESFAREFAVVSQQLEAIYRAGFLETAGGRDLDQLVRLVGIERRLATVAAGSAVFHRSEPAVGDITIVAGTRVSTREPPVVVFETVEERTLHRGGLSVEVPVAALDAGGAGVVPPRAISVIHRPIHGIEGVYNPEATALGAGDESDDALRARARRALLAAGRASTEALLGALGSLPGVRAKDVRIDENHIERPGVLAVAVAAPLDESATVRAIQLIEATRPAGVRVLVNLDAPASLAAVLAATNDRDEEETPPEEAEPELGALYFPVGIRAIVLPSASGLTPDERVALGRKVEDALRAEVDEAGIGETLIYNRLVAAALGVDGILDVTIDLWAIGVADSRHKNLDVPRTLRPSLATEHGGQLAIEVGGELVAFEVTVTVVLIGLAATLASDVAADVARSVITAELSDKIPTVTQVTPVSLAGLITNTLEFEVQSVSYVVEYLDAGVRVRHADQELTLDNLQRPWIRKVRVEVAE